MPPKLPGLYFDPDRNRYFPLASRPRPPPTPAPQSLPTDLVQDELSDFAQKPKRRRTLLWSATASMHHARSSQALLHDRLAGTRRGRVEPTGAAASLCALRMATAPDADGRTRQFLGDARGWVYSRSTTPSSSSSSVYDHNGDGNAGEGEDQWTPWAPEFCLHPNSEISAVCTAGARCVAVCFGPATKICVGDGGADGRAYLLSLTAVRDVRAASLQGRTLVLGAAQHAVLLSDIDASPVRTLDTHSDVFAVAQSDTLVYAGTRAGAAMRFDTRSGGGKRAAQVLFVNGNFGDSGHGPQMRSSVVFLQPTRGGQELVVGCMNGRTSTVPFVFIWPLPARHLPPSRTPPQPIDAPLLPTLTRSQLGSYDLRFVHPVAPPVTTYTGHASAVGARLGTTIDPAERFLFAAGADRRLRAWALASGAPVVPAGDTDLASASTATYLPANASPTQHNPFAIHFAAPLAALQVIDGVLWAGGGGEVWRWRLGL